MKHGDKIIWDSHFGYEVGYFIKESDDIMYNSYLLHLVTGSVIGTSLRSKDEIIEYTDENLQIMIKKYDYIKNFDSVNEFK